MGFLADYAFSTAGNFTPDIARSGDFRAGIAVGLAQLDALEIKQTVAAQKSLVPTEAREYLSLGALWGKASEVDVQRNAQSDIAKTFFAEHYDAIIDQVTPKSDDDYAQLAGALFPEGRPEGDLRALSESALMRFVGETLKDASQFKSAETVATNKVAGILIKGYDARQSSISRDGMFNDDGSINMARMGNRGIVYDSFKAAYVVACRIAAEKILTAASGQPVKIPGPINPCAALTY
jgi:hypothetical protein